MKFIDRVFTSNSSRSRILVMADHHNVRLHTGLLLSNCGFQVTTAQSARDALETAIVANNVGYRFHLIVMDLRDSEMDAVEAATLFRYADFEGPIIARSPHRVGNAEARFLAAGCSEVVFEPADGQRLCKVVERHLNAAPAHRARAA